jgi:hypothetical protein
MKNKKTKPTFGTFSNDGLSMGFAFLEFKDSDLAKMDNIIKENLRKIEEDFLEQLQRLDSIIKSEIGAIPRKEEFANWFFNKKKISELGTNLVKISDDEIIEYAKEYVKIFKAKIKQTNTTNASKSKDLSIISKGAIYNKEKLIDFFAQKIFCPETNREDIVAIFSYPIQKAKGNLKLKIYNKEFVFILKILKEEDILVNRGLFKRIEDCNCILSSNSTILKENNLDQAKIQLESYGLGNKNIEITIEKLRKEIKKH